LCDSLLRQIADRHPSALVRLHRLMVHQIFAHVRAGLDEAAAVGVTRAVFVEVWLLAPVSARWQNDAQTWLLAIADRRMAAQARAQSRPLSLVTVYDEHFGVELDVLLRQADRRTASETAVPGR